MDEQKRNSGIRHSVFISYAHEDEPLRQQLEAHLSLLRRQGLLADWHDHKILPGEDRARSIDEHLETASLILLLISPDFLASEYCYGVEMQRALERKQNGEVQVIPIILRPVDWESAPFAHLQCLPRDSRAITEWENRDAALRDIARGIRSAIEQLRSTSTPSQSMSTMPGARTTLSTRAHTMPPNRNRQRMLKRVHTTWIAGVLEQSLHGAALMALGLEEKTDVLDNPWRLLLQEVDRPTQPLPTGTRITEVYNETESGLLILGEPGAGKTTLLLELARDLLDRARTDESTPIPVIFNLSSWAKKRTALSNWLVEELSIRYEVPHRIGQSWVSEDQLLLLLDGLDEVAPEARKECIEAINNYRQTHPDVQIVVCCRSTEYLNEPTQLRLQTAVEIQPLTQEQIDAYLESAGEQAEVLREALRQDEEDLRELATTPLMLTILLFAYKGTSPSEISKLTSIEAKRDRIFALYVQHMLKRRGASKRYTPEQTIHWLTYLAQQMKRQSQTVFYLEQMQPDWLPKMWQRYIYSVLAGGIAGGLLCGLIGAVIGVILNWILLLVSNSIISIIYTSIPWPTIAAGLVIGSVIGQILGSLIGLFHIKSTELSTVEVIAWSWENVRLTALASIIGGPLGALTLSLASPSISQILSGFASLFRSDNYWLFFVVFILTCLIIMILPESICFIVIYIFTQRNLDARRSMVSKQRIWYAARRGALVGIFMVCIGLILWLLTATSNLVQLGIRTDIYLAALGCVSGLIIALTYGGVSHRQLETRSSVKPNQGIWRSLYNGEIVSLIVGLIMCVIYNIAILLTVIQVSSSRITQFPSNQVFIGGIAGVSIGLFFGLLNGGIACIKHVVLRLFLWRAKALPWNYVHFLDYATERILLRRVGGGYIFVHRLLLEYFSSSATFFPKGIPTVAVISDVSSVLTSTFLVDTTPREEKVILSVYRRKTGFRRDKRILTLLVIVLLLESSCIPSLFGMGQRSVQNFFKVSSVAYPPNNMSPVLDDPLKDNSI